MGAAGQAGDRSWHSVRAVCILPQLVQRANFLRHLCNSTQPEVHVDHRQLLQHPHLGQGCKKAVAVFSGDLVHILEVVRLASFIAEFGEPRQVAEEVEPFGPAWSIMLRVYQAFMA